MSPRETNLLARLYDYYLYNIELLLTSKVDSSINVTYSEEEESNLGSSVLKQLAATAGTIRAYGMISNNIPSNEFTTAPSFISFCQFIRSSLGKDLYEAEVAAVLEVEEENNDT